VRGYVQRGLNRQLQGVLDEAFFPHVCTEQFRPGEPAQVAEA
jgi:hypothetical protein